MASPKDAGGVGGLVSKFSRVVKARVDEFASEARDEVKSALQDARDDLDVELQQHEAPAEDEPEE